MGGYSRRKPLAGHVARQIEQAGASAYVWHDEELAVYADPKGFWRALAKTLRYIGSVATLLIAGALATRGGVSVIAAAALLLIPGALWRKLMSIPWYCSLGVIAVAVVTQHFTPSIAPWFAGSLLASWLVMRPRHRDFTLAATMLVTLAILAIPGMARESLQWLTVAGVAIIAIVGAYLGGTRYLPRPFAHITAEDITAKLPPPPSRLPMTLRIAKAKAIDNEPPEVLRKRVGGDGERQTAIMLLALKRHVRMATRIVHDVMIPGADRANADHLVLARSGLFVIDSKRFGTANDPGVVTYDQGSRSIVHRTDRGARSIESSLNTAAWAASSIGNVVGVPVTALLAVHNAAVTPGLRVERNGSMIEVISAWDLINRIDEAPQVLSWQQMATARVGFGRLRAALNGDPPEVRTARGMDSSARALFEANATRRGAVTPPPAPTATLDRDKPSPLASIRQARDAKKAARDAKRQERDVEKREHAESRCDATDSGAHAARFAPLDKLTPSVETPHLASSAPAPALATSEDAAQSPDVSAENDANVIESELVPILSPQDRVDARWEQMILSEPAAPDDIPADARALTQGVPISIIEFVDGDIKEYQGVAMSGPCHGQRGSYVWYCSPEQWIIHKTTGRHVNVASVSTNKVMIRHKIGEGR